MRRAGWWRKREDEPAAATNGGARPRSAGARELTDDPPRHLSQVFDPRIEAEVEAERAQQYSEWAERLRQKRVRAKEAMHRGDADTAEPTYWKSDDVFRESERLAQAELERRPDPVMVNELLTVLDLTTEPTTGDLEVAYRRLAKVHHPDFHVDDDEATRRFHADQMRRINEAYRTLKQVLPS